jgi:hypothetical protein
MRTRLAFTIFLGLALLVPIGAAPVLADQSFHTTRLPLALTEAGAAAGQPALRAGQVVDIHANGPTIFAIEQYLLNGALPVTDYQVILSFYTDTSCAPGGPYDFVLPGVTLTTDARGNAYGQARNTPADIPSLLHDTNWGIVWTFFGGGVAAYSTACAQVHID